ncbi:glutaredoxin [Sulfuricaulis limicola]|uniref:Glutaredoxin n=1 Tax=Sulfuricaulis limicola TaxID=1620215 RepID=A0A1B4XD21_9GAMM|nr:glutaredoxin 3 [Sulfuricaulis limicola]BAV32691.1 glutaredoxin [Sulfuricaulis limicola]
MTKVLMYSSRLCPYCRMAERLLEKKGAQTEKVMVDENPARRDEMIRRAGRTSVPQIFIGETHVGGYSELAELERAGQLDALLKS